ncbi:hypothetical protein NMY22_g8276 [Coprinellus aureogranulatus]|nr:hypothetical protein NMY22_g8276 [Coprinellus aureogranulatus]
MPDRSSRSGHARIKGMVFRTLDSLPPEKTKVKLDIMPSASQLYPVTGDIHRVIALRGIDVPQLPESLLSLKWVISEHSDGMNALRFDEDGVARACSLPHDYIQIMIKEQLRAEPNAREEEAEEGEMDVEAEDGDVESVMVDGQDDSSDEGPDTDSDKESDSESDTGSEADARTVLNHGEKELRLRAVLGLEINRQGGHKCDVGLTNASIPYAFFEYKTSLSAGATCWNHPIFSSAATTHIQTMSSLPSAIRNMISQCVYYAKRILVILGKTNGKLLVALVLPPTRLHYLLVDLGAGVVMVTENAIAVDDLDPNAPDYIPKAIKHLVNPSTWTLYWRQALWFHLLALFFNHPQLILDAEAADQSRDADQRRFPGGLAQKLQHDCQVLCTIPSTNSWTHILSPNILTRSIGGSVSDWVYRLGMFLAWKLLGTEGVLQRTHTLEAPNEIALIIDDQSETRSWTTRLPPGAPIRSHGGRKRFYIYHELKLIVKIFDPALVFEFNAEVTAYRHLSELQGTVIPKMYANGRIGGGLGFFLALSYEGEPRQEWDEEDRQQVRNLVKIIHSYDIHHHDIAPRNVVVSGTGKYTLVDLGLSKIKCSDAGCKEVENWNPIPAEALAYTLAGGALAILKEMFAYDYTFRYLAPNLGTKPTLDPSGVYGFSNTVPSHFDVLTPAPLDEPIHS